MFKNKLKISYYGATKTEDGIGLASKLHLDALKKNNPNNNLLIKEYNLSRNVGYQKNTNLNRGIGCDNLYLSEELIFFGRNLSFGRTCIGCKSFKRWKRL